MDQYGHILEPYWLMLNDFRNYLNSRLSYEPLILIGCTLFFTWLIVKIKKKFTPLKNQTFKDMLLLNARKFAMKLPYLGTKIQNEIEKVLLSLGKMSSSVYKNIDFITNLPEKGFKKSEILAKFNEYQSLSSINWKQGHVSGTVYCDYNDKEFLNLIKEIYGSTAYTNPLHFDVFPEIRKMESEIIRIVCNLFNGGPNSCGVLTTGGTESLILAVKAYRDYAINQKGIMEPEIVVPITAHPGFDKAAHLLNIKIVHIEINSLTKEANISSMKRAINSNTCLLVGSAPGYPYGIFDPIEEIAALGLRYNIPVHVDCCLGGFLIPFVEKAGFKLKYKCDMSVPGVTSISADSHKYGYAPKGTSILMYSDKKYRHEQYFVVPNWPGGIYASPTLLGSRMGGIISTCWASMLYFGSDGYTEAARKILTATSRLKNALKKIKGISIMGDPYLSVIAISSDSFDIFLLIDDLEKRGWNFNYLQFPSSFHICLTLMHTKEGIIEKIIDDIKELTEKHLKYSCGKKSDGEGSFYGMSQKIPDRSIISFFANSYLDFYYSTLYNIKSN